MPVSVLGRVPVNRGDILPVSGSLLPVTAGLQLWLRADMGVTLNDETAGAPNDFVSAWTLGATTVTPNAFVDPLGGTQASAVVASAVNTTHYLQQTIGNRVSGVLETWTVYIKAGALTWCAFGDNTGSHWAFVNLIAGVLGVQVGLTAATITSAGNGWWKVTVSSTGFNGAMGIFLAVSDNVYTPFAGDGVSNSIYLFGCTVSQPKVSGWADQSGQGHNAVQATAVGQPFWNPVGLNGKPSILWDGINDSMAANGLAAMMNGTDLPFTLIVAGHYVTLATLADPVCWSYSTISAPFQRWLLDGSLNYQTSRRDDAATIVTGTGPLAATVPPVILTEVFHGTTDEFFVSGTPRAGDPAPMNVGVISLMNRFTLGAIDVGGPVLFANFLIAEVIVYSTALSTADRQAVEAYLYQRYNLPSFVDPTSLPGCINWLRADLGLTLSNPTLLAANNFDDAAWAKGFSSVTPNATTDPFGGLSADKLVEDVAAASPHYMVQSEGNRVAGLVETWSIYVKAAGRTWVAFGDNTGSFYTSVNLTTGALVAQAGLTSRSIVDAGNGWWLVSVTATGFNGAFTVFLATGDGIGAVFYNGDGVSGVYLYGADVSQPTVSSWADQSGLGHDVAQVTKAKQPLWVAAAQNGYPAVRFDGVDDLLTGLFAYSTTKTVLFVYKMVTRAGVPVVYSGGTAAASFANYSVPPPSLGMTESFTIGVTTDVANNVFAQQTNVINGASSSIRVARVQVLAGDTGASVNWGGITLGALVGPSNWANMELAEIIAYSRVLTAAEMATVEVYLSVRYATP